MERTGGTALVNRKHGRRGVGHSVRRNRMGLYFGNIESVDVYPDEVRITGHKRVALAFGENDPFLVTRLLGVTSQEVAQEKINALRSVADVYESRITREQGYTVVRIEIHGEETVEIRCAQVTTEHRYYNAAEIREIFHWLPSRSTSKELAIYITQFVEHGFRVSFRDGQVLVEEIGTAT